MVPYSASNNVNSNARPLSQPRIPVWSSTILRVLEETFELFGAKNLDRGQSSSFDAFPRKCYSFDYGSRGNDTPCDRLKRTLNILTPQNSAFTLETSELVQIVSSLLTTLGVKDFYTQITLEEGFLRPAEQTTIFDRKLLECILSALSYQKNYGIQIESNSRKSTNAIRLATSVYSNGVKTVIATGESYRKRTVPGTKNLLTGIGMSFDIDATSNVLLLQRVSLPMQKKAALLLIKNDDQSSEMFSLAASLRSVGVAVEMSYPQYSLKENFDYGRARNYPYAISFLGRWSWLITDLENLEERTAMSPAEVLEILTCRKPLKGF